MAEKNSIFISDEEKLKIHLSLSYSERFRVLMRLIKIDQKLKNAKIIKAKP